MSMVAFVQGRVRANGRSVRDAKKSKWAECKNGRNVRETRKIRNEIVRGCLEPNEVEQNSAIGAR